MSEDLAARTRPRCSSSGARQYAGSLLLLRPVGVPPWPGMTETDVGYRLLAAEFEDAREQVEAWEAFTPNRGDW
jgi:hypothetical protein